MSHLTRARPRPGTALLTVCLLLGMTPVAAATATDPPAAPAPAGSAEIAADVRRLGEQVRELQVAAETAVEDYNETTAELQELMQQEVVAQIAVDDASDRLRNDQGAAERRVRALYRSGGRTEIALAAWQAGDLASVMTTYRSVGAVLAADATAITAAAQVSDEAIATTTTVQGLRRSRAAVQAEADTRRAAAEQALRASRLLLAGADEALVAALAAEQRLAEERAVQAAAQRALTEQATQRALLDAPGFAGPGGGTVQAGVAPGSNAAVVIQRAVDQAPTDAAADAIRQAATRLGLPYTWGATGPDTFDCSGLTQWAYRQAGVGIPRTSRQQYAGLRQIPVTELAPGDLVFYASGVDPGSIHHVSMYLGDGLLLTAPTTGDVVKIAPVWRQPIYGAARPVG